MLIIANARNLAESFIAPNASLTDGGLTAVAFRSSKWGVETLGAVQKEGICLMKGREQSPPSCQVLFAACEKRGEYRQARKRSGSGAYRGPSLAVRRPRAGREQR